jgi:adiponectin receptor
MSDLENGDRLEELRLRNEFIQKGFLSHTEITQAFAENCCSLKSNEIANVWTCVIWFWINIGLILYIRKSDNSRSLIIGICIFQLNLVITSLYHSLLSIKRYYSILSALDLVGISVAISSGHFIIYKFQLISMNQFIFNMVLTSSIAIGAFIYRLWSNRESSKLFLAIFVVFQASFYLSCYAFGEMSDPKGISVLCISSILSLVLGGIIFWAKFPERYKPNYFDYFGNSHMIWHMLYMLSYFLMFIDMYLRYCS